MPFIAVHEEHTQWLRAALPSPRPQISIESYGRDTTRALREEDVDVMMVLG